MTAPAGELPSFALVLVPTAELVDQSIDYYYDFSQNHAEFARAFAALGMAWRWQPVTSQNHRAVLEAFSAEMGSRRPVVFNLCDGDETNDVPGISVIRCLNELGLRYTGANEAFYRVTTSKIDMKHAFDAAGVATAPWAVVDRRTEDGAAHFDRLGNPLIIKPAVSAGSMGITIKSVVDNAAALREQVQQLHDGYKGWNLVSGGVLVERFVSGPEFTTLVVGSANDPDHRIIYPPIERVFHHTLPAAERFLSYDRLWEVYERESHVGAEGEYLWEYAPAPAHLHVPINALSWDAHVAVGGCGYSRVDLRMDATTGELYVLEVNAQCGLSEDENHTSIGAILRFAQRTFADLVREIILASPPHRLGGRPVNSS